MLRKECKVPVQNLSVDIREVCDLKDDHRIHSVETMRRQRWLYILYLMYAACSLYYCSVRAYSRELHLKYTHCLVMLCNLHGILDLPHC